MCKLKDGGCAGHVLVRHLGLRISTAGENKMRIWIIKLSDVVLDGVWSSRYSKRLCLGYFLRQHPLSRDTCVSIFDIQANTKFIYFALQWLKIELCHFAHNVSEYLSGGHKILVHFPSTSRPNLHFMKFWWLGFRYFTIRIRSSVVQFAKSPPSSFPWSVVLCASVLRHFYRPLWQVRTCRKISFRRVSIASRIYSSIIGPPLSRQSQDERRNLLFWEFRSGRSLFNPKNNSQMR